MRRLTTAVLALALLGTTPVLAADYNRDYNRDNSYQDRHDSYRHSNYRHDYNRHHRWHRGDKLSRSWFLYTPVNWRHHHFRAPSYGYHWIYVDGYFLLIDRNGFVIEVVVG